MDRREFIRLLGLAGTSAAAYTACSAYMREALAKGPETVEALTTAAVPCIEGSLEDIEHVIILMQENRSFDHYFGTLRGVRGFGDPRPLKLRNDEPVWQQALPKDASGKAQSPIQPYHLPMKPEFALQDAHHAGAVFLEDPAHDYTTGIAAWNNGWMDQWGMQKGVVSLAHYVEENIPLYFKLAKAFTLCDAYFCSVNGPTDPNRSYFWTATSAGFSDNSSFSGSATQKGIRTWATYPEKLEKLGVSWNFYQDGLTWNAQNPFDGNYGDNTLEYFDKYMGKSSVLYKKNQSINSVLRTDADKPSQFEADILNDTLPAVSWIVPPEAFSEHPKWPPEFGEYYVHEILRALAANKEVWKKTALFITYDENGGFFDHVPPPVPPLKKDVGKVSSGIVVPEPASTFNVDAESPRGKNTPLGMGTRVPTLVISPWSTGGRVCSEVFDHTSFIRFLDEWLIAHGKQDEDADAFPNISSWRYAVAGDLTSTFDFYHAANPGTESLAEPGQSAAIFTSAKREAARQIKGFSPKASDTLPDKDMPVRGKQDNARCEILPLAYDFTVTAARIYVSGGAEKLTLTFANYGPLAAAFTVYSYDRTDGPWFYTVEGSSDDEPNLLTDLWDLRVYDTLRRAPFDYHLAVHGPNGHLNEFRGNSNSTEQYLADVIDVSLTDDEKGVHFHFSQWPEGSGKLKMISAYTGKEQILPWGTKFADTMTVDGWYDVSFVDAVNTSRYLRRYAGRLETGTISKSDPAIGMIYDEVKRIYKAGTV